MLKLLDGLSVDWTHYARPQPKQKKPSLMDRFSEGKEGTTCLLEHGGQVFSGHSHVGKGDTFCKETGRKVSLKRALKEAGLSRYERGRVWEAYFSRFDSEQQDGSLPYKVGSI